MKNKKSSFSFIALLIVVLTLLIVLVIYVTRASNIYENVMNKQTCKSSIKIQDLSTIKNLPPASSDINCPMQRIEIKDKDEDDIKASLAKAYFDVCDEFGQGQLNLFGKRETTFCVIRDKITFKDKDVIIDDFAKYIAERKIPRKDLTYAEFCSGFQTTRAQEIFGEKEIKQLENIPIDTGKEYAIIYVYAKGEEEIREITSVLFGTTSSHTSMYIGAGMVTGGGILIYTGYGSIVGVPLIIAGSAIGGGGLTLNLFTNEDLKMEWASFFIIREFDENELKKLPCEYLPAEQ